MSGSEKHGATSYSTVRTERAAPAPADTTRTAAPTSTTTHTSRSKPRCEAVPAAPAENPLGTERMSRLVLRTGVPLMFSLLINSLYNFVDSVFVSHISEEALTALSLSAPLQALVAAMGCGIAIGLNAVISTALGAKNEQKVRETVRASLFLGFCAWILVASLCLLFAKTYFLHQSGGNGHIAEYGQQYLSICMVFSLGQLAQWCFDRYVIASGKSSLFIFTLSTASVTNLILDPILIFGLLGFPALGVRGAALATVIGQHVGAVAGYLINRRWNKEIPIALPRNKSEPNINGRTVFEIVKIGLPTTFVMGITSFVTVFLNAILISFSATAVAVFGVCTRIQNLFLVPPHGINNAVIPIVAYNYGAKRFDRIHQVVRWALLYSFAFMAPLLFALEFFPAQVLRLFDASPELLALGIPALRTLSVGYTLSIFAMIFSSTLQALSFSRYSMALNLTRQVILPVVLAGAAGFLGNPTLIWWALVAAELCGVPLALGFWQRVTRRSFPQ